MIVVIIGIIILGLALTIWGLAEYWYDRIWDDFEERRRKKK